MISFLSNKKIGQEGVGIGELPYKLILLPLLCAISIASGTGTTHFIPFPAT